MTTTAKRDRRAYAAAYRLAHPEQTAAYAAEYQAAHRERLAAYNAAYYADRRERAWVRGLRVLYNITATDYADLLEAQGGACAVCGAPPIGQRLDVDHDHSHCDLCAGRGACGLAAIRGLLCGTKSGRACNYHLGHYEETGQSFPPDLIPAAESYLARYSALSSTR